MSKCRAFVYAGLEDFGIAPIEAMAAGAPVIAYGKGGILDDLLVYRMNNECYLLVVNASNIKKDWDWISMHNTDDVDMENISDKTSLLAVQGPKATLVLQNLTDMNISDMKYYTFQKGTFAGKENVLISSTGYT